jgi:hypothetical protein
MYTLWIAEEPNGTRYAGEFFATPRTCSDSFPAIAAYAREAAIHHERTIRVRREDFAAFSDFEAARDHCIAACDDAYIAEGERQADEMYAATHDEGCFLLIA